MLEPTRLKQEFEQLNTQLGAIIGSHPRSSTEFTDGLSRFFQSYLNALLKRPQHDDGLLALKTVQVLQEYLILIRNELDAPKKFGHFHEMERSPYDFYQFGLAMVMPLIDTSRSCLLGHDNLKQIESAIHNKENVILLANHQAEIDPQIISYIIQTEFPQLAESIICVAGHRVTTDPLAIPFSRGRNLICIHSKKYIDHPPELKADKLAHNARAMSHLEALLNQGGVFLYVAPSGGRDRYIQGSHKAEPAPFDPQSVEMFRLLSKKAKKKTHLHLLALHSIENLPPPRGINIQLGEERAAFFAPAGLHFGRELGQEELEELGQHLVDKQEKRKYRADTLTESVRKMYTDLIHAIGIQHELA